MPNEHVHVISARDCCGSKSQVEDALVDFEFANNGMERPEFSVKIEFDVESVYFHARSLVRLGKFSEEGGYYDEAIRILERLSTLLWAGIETRLSSDIELARGRKPIS